MQERLRTRDPDFSDRLKYVAMAAATVAPIVIVLIAARESVLYALPVVIVLIAALIWWHARNTAYRCGHCGREFVVSAWKDAFSPHMLETKYLRCPECGKRSWAKSLVREE
jgi:DNA-directed RNA polymerase subunit RPC12/RpoP